MDDAHPSGVIQRDVESHLLTEETISSISAETYENLIPCDHNSPPLALIWGYEWLLGTSTHSGTRIQ
jgi:hypothetical protein